MSFNNNASNYSGEVITQIFTELTTGNELIEKGLFRVLEGGYESKLYIPVTSSETVLQGRVTEPVSSGSTDYNEVTINMEDVMIFTEFLPKNFEHIWRKFQSKGPLVFSELSEEVQAAMINAILANKGVLVSEIAFQGDKSLTGSTNVHLKRADGIIKLALANSDVKDVVSPSAITTSNVVTALRKVWDTSRVAVRTQPNFKFLMSAIDFDKYVDAQADSQFKGGFYTEGGVAKFKGKEIIVLNSLPENTIIGTTVGTDDSSNLYMGAGLVIDHETMEVAKKSNGSEKWYVKMLFKLGFNLKYGKDLTLYTV